MSDKINEVCDNLKIQLDKIANNLEIVELRPAFAVAFLDATQEKLEALREETIRKIEDALVPQKDHEEMVAELTALRTKCAALEEENKQLKQTRFASIAQPGDKRWRAPPSEAGDSPPRRRHRELTSIEEMEEVEPSLILSFRSSAEQREGMGRRELARLQPAPFWGEADNRDGDYRLRWVERHSAFSNQWSVNDKMLWRAQMAEFVQTKDLTVVSKFLDDYAFGDKREEPPTPRGCFFGRVKKRKCSPGGDNINRSGCEFCSKSQDKCHCTAAFVEDIAVPYPARNEDGSLEKNAEYNAVAPFFNDSNIRYAWEIHA